ncbi:hypothetical protein B484DRAFT_424932 [Ochromonadaceae sp. CCMP2298]|nr:hypothetical protein B484DRAFT_424932 [Ochromonadaceae sp. CCMP2298]
MDEDFNHANSGRPLTKQVSMSLITPHTLTGYTDFFRQNSNREDGWISIKIGSNDTFRNKWVVFDDGELKYAPHPSCRDEEYTHVPMNSVVKLRADSSSHATILITTLDHETIFLRLASVDEVSVL